MEHKIVPLLIFWQFYGMDFLRRLKFYGFGFGLGLMIVYAMFGTRSCTTANEMKIQELTYQQLNLSDKALCKLKALRKNGPLLKLELKQFMVDYDKSEVHQEPCGMYYLVPKEEYAANYNYRLVMYDCDTISRVDDIMITTDTIQCDCK